MNKPAVTQASVEMTRPSAAAGGGLMKRMQWLLAWEQAYLSQGSVGSRHSPAAERAAASAGAGTPDAATTFSPGDSTAEGLRANPGSPAPSNQATAVSVNEAVPQSPWARAAGLQRSPEILGAAFRSEAALLRNAGKPAVAPPSQTGRFARVAAQALSERSVHVVREEGGLGLVIRDPHLSPAAVLGLAGRLRELVAGLSVRLASVVLNGELVWSDRPDTASSEDDDRGGTNEKVNRIY